MFESFRPNKLCSEFVDIKGHSVQLTMIMAVVKGIKPCMDDWIRIEKFAQYSKACKRYGLIVKPDTLFDVVSKDKIPNNVAGRERLTTTNAFGFKFKQNQKDKTVHIFIAKTKKNLEQCFNDGWYPLVINNRVIDRPLVDSFKFGYSLGYPSCCIEFFQRFNNWYKFSYLFEAYKNTACGDYNFLCNPFTKDVIYSYIYHMPCSYNCDLTAKDSLKLRSAIYEEEPHFVEMVDRHLKLPLLVFYERKFYAFEGQMKKDRLYYKNVCFIGQMPENNLYEAKLKNGDCISLEGDAVVITKKGRLTSKIYCKKDSFAPETPFIIQFH